MRKEFKSNEELVVMFRESGDEAYLQELINQNEGLLHLLVRPYVASIPNAELEDLISESYIAMYKACEDFDIEQGYKFTTLLKAYVCQHLNRLYNKETRKKRYTGSTPISYESLAEINKEGGDIEGGTFIVECEDFSSVEFKHLLSSLKFNEKEQIAVKVLMNGGKKGEVADALECSKATATYYVKSIRKKFVLAGVTL